MKDKKNIKLMMQWILSIMGVIVLAISLRVFFFDTYVIPTPSMEPAIVAGDHVVTNKLVPGPRIVKNFFSLSNGEKPDITRLYVRKIKRNDILIFNYPYSDWNRLGLDMGLHYAKRCVALPGDTFYIENGFYRVKDVADTLGYIVNQRILSEKGAHDFRPELFHCFPDDPQYGWTMKDFGPLYIPGRDDKLAIDTLNVMLYGKLIEYEMQKPVSIKNGTVVIGDSLIHEYRFLKNYYFMAGDYVFDSQDSRYWGLLPEDHIKGKVAFVWNTKDLKTGKKHWKRFLKKIK